MSGLSLLPNLLNKQVCLLGKPEISAYIHFKISVQFFLQSLCSNFFWILANILKCGFNFFHKDSSSTVTSSGCLPNALLSGDLLTCIPLFLSTGWQSMVVVPTMSIILTIYCCMFDDYSLSTTSCLG